MLGREGELEAASRPIGKPSSRLLREVSRMIVKDQVDRRLEPSLLGQVETLAKRQKLSKSLVIESAVASFLSPDSTERLEATFARRLDHLTRQLELVERNVAISTEALALFVRFWLTTTSPAPAGTEAAAQATGRNRYGAFVQALARRLAKGDSVIREISEEVPYTTNNGSGTKPEGF
jgi:predicted transcriptional regulator